MASRASLVLLAAILAAAPVRAQTAAGAYDHSRAATVHAAPKSGEVVVDGRLDEAAWSAAPVFAGFTQRDPDEGRPPTERTEVRVLVGDHHLYIGARLYDSDPSGIRAPLTRRDEIGDSDDFTVWIDSRHDHLTAFLFEVNPAGSIGDAALGSDGSEDFSWDPVWQAAATIDSLGWAVEMRIPLSQLRYSAGADEMGIQIKRFIVRKQERDFLAFIPKDQPDVVARWGHLAGLGGLPRVERFEILPYVSSRETHQGVDDGDPFHAADDLDAGAGADVKLGVTSNLTLDATLNPDFGQVEVDPAVVNLSAFETFFPEKRPFFVEGAEIFQFGNLRTNNSSGFQQVFHGRRIGRAPQRELDEDDGFRFVDGPTETTIAAAAKLTGKTSGGWSIGALDAVTTEEEARYVDPRDVRRETPVEPATNYFVGRLRRDLRGGETVVGGILTAVHRRLDDPALEDLLRQRAYVGGLDLNHAWAHREYSFDAFVAGSRVEGSPAAIQDAQEASARYFQRPDADYVEDDSTRTALSGYTAQAAFQKGSGEHWLGSLTYQETSPGYELNDVGFISETDRRSGAWIVIYKVDDPGRVLRDWNVYAFSNHVWNYGGDPLFNGAAVAGNLKFLNFWSLYWRLERDPEAKDDRLTRGGPLADSPAADVQLLGFVSDTRKPYTVEGSVRHQGDAAGGDLTNVDLALDWRPLPAAELRFEPALERNHDLAQYVTTQDDPLAEETFGARYVFGTLDQTTLSLTTRIGWSFTRDVNLQLFVQPLVSAGDYRDFKEFRRPKTYEFDVYGRDRGTIGRTADGDVEVDPDGPEEAPAFSFEDPSFNLRSLRVNAVLRWEWRPGSTLFLVWQHQREESLDFGDFDLGRDLGGLLDGDATNVVAVKATYWFGR